MMMQRDAGGFFGMLAVAVALLAVQASPARAQAAKGLIDPNTAAESELQGLPAPGASRSPGSCSAITPQRGPRCDSASTCGSGRSEVSFSSAE